MAEHTLDQTPVRIKISDDTRLSELTVGQFKTLMNELLQKTVWEIEQMLPDPDEGLEFRPEIAEVLRQNIEHPSDGEPIDDILRELDLEE